MDNLGGPEQDGAAPVQASLPRWVKRFLIVAAVVVALGVLVMVLIGGEHGPARHSSLGSVSTGPFAVTELSRVTTGAG